MKLDKIFSSNMVFAAGKPIRIYGSGRGEAEISFGEHSEKIVSEDEKWIVNFPPMNYGGPYVLTFTAGEENVVFDNIYIGKVYLMAGQSNIEFKMKETNTLASSFDSLDSLRLFSTERTTEQDYFTPHDGWQPCRKDEVKHWSAIAYYTGEKIAREKDIAVGVIACYQGASVIESWVPEGTFKKIGINLTNDEKFGDHTAERYSAWNKDGFLYDFALSQVIPFSLSGVVWYQGESDASVEEARVYKKELKELIKVWRKAFDDEKLPFVVVQIADCIEREGDAWSLIQKAQYDIQYSAENVKTAISRDVCENDDIHPKTKNILSKRIADLLIKYGDM